MKIRIATSGDIETVTVVHGAAILAEYAKKNIVQWRFIPAGSASDLHVRFTYQLREIQTDDPRTFVSLENDNEVLVIANQVKVQGHPEIMKKQRR